jgi:hypothetical protein
MTELTLVLTASHRPSIAGFQQFGRRTHISHFQPNSDAHRWTPT